MKFSARTEQESNLGPLIATALKGDVPIFGPHSYKNHDVKARLTSDLKEIVLQPQNHVVDMNESKSVNGSALLVTSNARSVKNQTDDAGLAITKHLAQRGTPGQFLSSSEQHDQKHYAALRTMPGTKEQHEKLDKVMLRRAKDGYLFNSKLNMTIVSEDRWLQDVWGWVNRK